MMMMILFDRHNYSSGNKCRLLVNYYGQQTHPSDTIRFRWVKLPEVKVNFLFIYIAYRKASAYSCRFFCCACFQLRSTITGTLLLI